MCVRNMEVSVYEGLLIIFSAGVANTLGLFSITWPRFWLHESGNDHDRHMHTNAQWQSIVTKTRIRHGALTTRDSCVDCLRHED